MLRLDPNLIIHHLNVDPKAKLVKKKQRKIHPHIAFLVKTKLKKLLDLGFIRSVSYQKWVFSIVQVSKSIKNTKVCMNFRDLNKACLKDDFPLSSINIIVDFTTRHKMFSLMDGFLGYN